MLQFDNEEDFYHLLEEYHPTEFFHKAFSVEKPYLFITKYGYNTIDFEIRTSIVRRFSSHPPGFLFHLLKQHILEMWYFEITDENQTATTGATKILDDVR